MLREQIIPAIQEIAGRNLDNIYFLRDGAPPHYGINVNIWIRSFLIGG